ncbi:hypothetical protein PoB_002136600 [Plakobranchus ocellatus]|uniref:Uncharacterized protein n=1 Tax=Plakobranchus ocellatus TaxID=259542 RepID=A0AAV3ZG19_9GAST|nr:hypothetical protein PoB_002136600 [Plakobranchus ocellatus]
MDLYQEYMLLTDNLGINKKSRLEWIQSCVVRDIERREREHGRDERAAERAAEIKNTGGNRKAKTTGCLCKKGHTKSFVFGSRWRSPAPDSNVTSVRHNSRQGERSVGCSRCQSSSGSRSPALGRHASTSKTDMSSKRSLSYGLPLHSPA